MNRRKLPAAAKPIPPAAVPIGGLIDKVMSSVGMAATYRGWQVVDRWAEIAGEQLARSAPAIKFDDGTLFLACDSAAWRQTLHYKLPELLAAIHRFPFGSAVRQIALVTDREREQIERIRH